jgi:hypothetical protein
MIVISYDKYEEGTPVQLNTIGRVIISTQRGDYELTALVAGRSFTLLLKKR